MDKATPNRNAQPAQWAPYTVKAGKARAVARHWIKGPGGERSGHYPTFEAAQRAADEKNAAADMTDAERAAIDTAMHEDKLRNGYDQRRIAAAEQAEREREARYARTLYPYS